MQPSSPDQEEYRVLLQRLATVSPPLFIMGRFAEEALLLHRITEPHADLDVLVMPQQLNPQLQQLTALGWAASAPSLDEGLKPPLILRAHGNSPPIELWVSTREPNGDYCLEVEGHLPAQRYRIYMPEDTFHYPATRIEGMAHH